MTETAILPDERIGELASGFRDLRWSWAARDVPELAAALGWRVHVALQSTVWLDAGFGPTSGNVKIENGADAVMINAATCSSADPDATGDEAVRERRRLRDEFARVVGLVAERLGEPSARIHGEAPEVRWEGPATTVGVRSSEVRVTLFVAVNDYLKTWDEEA
ncbi:DUF6301 family protein [Actinomadura harenae]|uniref:Uncharacterized protein n=1 Tax=Actinomadura harenae TaxID=2483351 RepID=A0A3M2LPU6_9ACTN|nr:DUF6301 family protein [Actinomadura harenae]RMI36868.1 hypothetical protein EBO15_37470 [Actinomadura harenae]